MKLKDACCLEESYDKPRQCIKRQRHFFADKGLYSQSYCFSSSHVWMWEMDHKEGWVPKNWCFWIVVLEKTLESPLDSKEIKPVNPKGNQPWIFTARTDAKVEAPTHGHLIQRANSGRSCCWERLRAGEGDDREWDGWMSLQTQWTWVWANFRRQWRTEKPGML